MNTRAWRRWSGALALTTGLVLAGCGEESPFVSEFSGFSGLEAPEMQFDLSAEDGGTGIEAEAPAFGDSYIATRLTEDEEVLGDPLERDERMRSLETHPQANVRYLRVVWGNLRNAPGVDRERDCTPLDWSGSARVSDGFLLPARTIAFDRRDRIVPPWEQDDPSRQKVEWISHTCPHVDGIVFKIVVPAAGDTNLTDLSPDAARDGLGPDDVFVFRTGPLTIEFPLQDLADLDTTLRVDDENGVSFTGFTPDDIDRCPRGTMSGAWVKVENDDRSGGLFRMKISNAVGRMIGHARGRWGVTEDGQKVFVGKIIGRQGEYLGHMRGHWNVSPDGPGQGGFRGAWFVRNTAGESRAHGMLEGRWAVSDRIENGGFLKAVWKANCGPATDPAE